MGDEIIRPAQLPSIQNDEKENSPRNQTRQLSEKKEVVRRAVVNGNKVSSPKRPKGSLRFSRSADRVDLKDKKEPQKNHSTEDMQLETNLSSELSDDESLQGAPMSMKNLFKVVKTFSKRVPKTPKPRPEPTKEKKDADVVVFERSTTAEAVPGSLPPILDFHDLVGSDTIFDDDRRQGVDRATSESGFRARTIDDDLTLKSHEKVGKRPAVVVGNGSRRHRCSGFLHELAPDALQEFGSFDSSIPCGGSERRKSRKSLGFLYNQLDEHETLHF